MLHSRFSDCFAAIFGGESVVWIVDVFSLAVQCNLVLLIILLVMTEFIVSTQECLGALSLY